MTEESKMNRRQRTGHASGGMAAACVVAVALSLAAGCSRKGMPPDSAEERGGYAALRAENDALRRENQRLRRELVAKKGAGAGSAAADAAPVKGVQTGIPEPQDPDTGYWLSEKSHIRHNPRCRNYRKVKGRSCGPDDGKPCKNCGG